MNSNARHAVAAAFAAVFASAAPCTAPAASVVVTPMPASPFADTEVSTNIAIRTGRTLSREVEIHIQLDGTPTNCLEVAFGRDANANGVLDAEETESEAAASAQRGVIDILLKNNASLVPRRFAATCGGEAAFAQLATRPPPEWLFREGWDMVRVTRRGAGVPSEWVSCKFDYTFFTMTLR